jgi:hypothetical protein
MPMTRRTGEISVPGLADHAVLLPSSAIGTGWRVVW